MKLKKLDEYSTKLSSVYISDDGYLYTDYRSKTPYRKTRYIDKKGFYMAKVKVRGKRYKVRLNIEMARAFIPNPNNYRCTLFKDGVKTNLSVDNLYWSADNGMDYDNKQNYKDYSGTVGDYTVVDNGEKISFTCLSCNDVKVIKRKKFNDTSTVCYYCDSTPKFKPLDVSSLDFTPFYNWHVTETEESKYLNCPDKTLNLKCKCCGQRDTISYKSFKLKRVEYECDILSEKKRVLRKRLEGMKKRCYSKNCKSYHRYGGRGIKICDEWLGGSKNFIDWGLNNGFHPNLEIDREDNDGDYSPDNCRFVTGTENSRNQSTNVLTHELVKRIKNTDWGKKSARLIALELGLKESNGPAVHDVRIGHTWKDVE